MNTASFRIMIRSDRPKKSGEYALCIRVTIARKFKLFPIGFDVLPRNFDQGKSQVKKTDPFYFQKNKLILKAETKARKIAFDFAINDKPLTLGEFIKAYTNDNYGSVSFYDYIEYLILKRDNELSTDTLDMYRKQLSKLRRFRATLTFSEVNDDFIGDYRNYMIKKLNNKEITYYKCLEFIKRICNRAYKEKKISENPLRNLEIKRLKGDSNFLTIEELLKLDTIYQEQTLPANLQNVLRYFLFSCYTGIRYGDIYNLRFPMVKVKENTTYLDFMQHKTNKPALIPLIDQAKALIPDQGFTEQKVFNVMVNQTTNKLLKTIMEKAGIEKRITFHSGRHTCSNSLYQLDVDINTRCMIIGDTKEVINKHYTKEDMNMKLQALNKFSQAMKAKSSEAAQELQPDGAPTG